jgi:UDP-N-acetylglucosamine 2-epimerase (non-hydrolysing)
MKILVVVGARPNFMKIAPIIREFKRHPDLFEYLLLHTGQHYNDNMSKVFFEELNLPWPDVNLEVGSGSHAWQTAEIMRRFEPILIDYQPDWVLVPGDVNSTLACALVASKLNFRVAHVEAGLRSFDRSMPEEINRLLTDQLADLLLTPSQEANENLRREGVAEERIRFVGNVMIDTLVHLQERAAARWPKLQSHWGLNRFGLVTLHRPANVDDLTTLAEIMAALMDISQELPILFPVHPRTRGRIAKLQSQSFTPTANLILTEPSGYLDFLALELHASLVITDSGGVQEETTYLGIPCLTVRPNTERPITLTEGTNQLVEGRREALIRAAHNILNVNNKRHAKNVPQFWDGQTAQRIVQVLHSVELRNISAEST